MRIMFAAAISACLAMPAFAEGFSKVSDRNAFVSLMQAGELTRMGIKLNVTPDGKIKGRALGYDVTGNWTWKGGYFCRDLYWGGDDLGANCQEVRVQGNTVRFTSDKGTGDYADLRIK
ncbi:MAG: dihydrodipicolinate reductase [Roseovarius sp.]